MCGYLQCGDIMNNSVINILLHVCEHLFLYFCWAYAQEWDCGSKHVCIICQQFPKVLESIFTPASPNTHSGDVMNFCCTTSLPKLDVVSPFVGLFFLQVYLDILAQYKLHFHFPDNYTYSVKTTTYYKIIIN